jgi:hypothetical protein
MSLQHRSHSTPVGVDAFSANRAHTCSVTEHPRRPDAIDASGHRTDEGPVLPTVSRDEQDVGWGDEPRERDAEWYERERPPHHE